MTSPKHFRVRFTKGISKGDGEDVGFDPNLQTPSISLQVSVLVQHQNAYIGDECSELSDFEELIDDLKGELEAVRATARKKFAEEAHRREIEETRAKGRKSKK